MKCTDHEAPVVICPANQTLNTAPSQMYAAVIWADPKVTDNSGENLTLSCDFESGSNFEIGETEVICQAMDPAGNCGTCLFTVKIEGKRIT